MNKFLRNILALIAVLFVQVSFSQNLTYSEFMHLEKIKHWSELNEYLSLKGFKYAGSRSVETKTIAAWTKNCNSSSFDSKGNLNWRNKKGASYGVILIDEWDNTNNRKISFEFSGKSTYDLFLQTAKRHGFNFLKDDISNDYISSYYVKKDKKNNVEYLVFHTKKNGYCVQYCPYQIDFSARDNKKNKSYNDNLGKPINVENSNSKVEPKTTGAGNQAVKDRFENVFEYTGHIEKSFEKPVISGSGLEGYTLEYFPIAPCPGPGTIIIKVTVNSTGTVSKATVVGGSLKGNSRACSICVGLALRSRFRVPRNVTTERCGTITYTIK